MMLKIALLLTVFALVGAEEEACGGEKAEECAVNLLTSIFAESTDEEDCAALKEASSCLDKADEDCTEDARNEEIDEGRQFLKLLVAVNCPREDLPEEIEQCVSGLEMELLACVDDAVAELMEKLLNQPEDAEVNEDDVKCEMYESITKCVVDKVDDKCGEDASLAALGEMINDEEFKESCSKATTGGNEIRELMNELAQKKRK